MGMFDEVLDNVGKPYAKGFEAGTWPVVIGTVELKAKDTKKGKGNEIIEVVVFDKEDNDKKATCTLWFHTEGAAKMSVTKVLGMLVHKVADEKKDQVRDLGKKLFGSVSDISEARKVAFKLMQEKLLGSEAFLVAEPQGDYTTTAYGDLWHYPAESRSNVEKSDKVEDADDLLAGSEQITDENLPKFEGDEGDDL